MKPVNLNLTRIRIRIRILNPSPFVMHTSLDHEKLEVYQASLEFITWTIPLLEGLPGSASVRNQLDRASTSVPLNIAEGNGKFTSPDRCRFFDNARGSALESAACRRDGRQEIRQRGRNPSG